MGLDLGTRVIKKLAILLTAYKPIKAGITAGPKSHDSPSRVSIGSSWFSPKH